MTIKEVTYTDSLIVDIFIHVIILLIILSSVFWILVVPLGKKTINNEINKEIEHLIYNKLLSNPHCDDIRNITEDSISDAIYDVYTSISSNLQETYNEPDQTAQTYNKWLLKVNIIIIILLIISFIIMIIILKQNCNKNINVFKILSENIFLFLLIGVVEYFFFINIATQYVPVLPSTMIDEINNKIQELNNKNID